MLARDTWVNHFFAGHKVHIGRTKLETRVNYTLFHQLMDERTRKEFEPAAKATSSLWGDQ